VLWNERGEGKDKGILPFFMGGYFFSGWECDENTSE